jgi:hypothetical protein
LAIELWTFLNYKDELERIITAKGGNPDRLNDNNPYYHVPLGKKLPFSLFLCRLSDLPNFS